MSTDVDIWTPGGEVGPAGPTGPQGPPGPAIELRTNDTHVQWRVEGDVTWIDLEPLENLIGPEGPVGATGSRGDPGDSGSAIELQTSATHIQWRVVGDASWINLISLASLEGAPGQASTILRDTGAPDDALDGEDGDYYIREDEPDIGVVLYGPKELGEWPSNFISLAGQPGEPSDRVVLNGSGAPANSVGTNGDFYIDTDVWDIFGPKAGGAWPAGVSLIGPVEEAPEDGTAYVRQDAAWEEQTPKAHYGQLNITNNTTTIAVSAATDPTLISNADYTQITGIWNALPHGLNNGVTQQANSITVARAGVYRVEVWANATASNNNVVLGVKFAINGTISLERRPRARLPNTGDVGQLAAHGFVQLAAGDVITLWHASTVATNVTWADMVFSIAEMHTV